jgi:hypothetical protein
MAARKFNGRRITKETLAIGVGGQLERPDGQDLPPRGTVDFHASATVAGVKHTYGKGDTVEEQTTLVIVGPSFVIDEVYDHVPEVEQLPGMEDEGAEG